MSRASEDTGWIKEDVYKPPQAEGGTRPVYRCGTQHLTEPFSTVSGTQYGAMDLAFFPSLTEKRNQRRFVFHALDNSTDLIFSQGCVDSPPQYSNTV